MGCCQSSIKVESDAPIPGMVSSQTDLSDRPLGKHTRDIAPVGVPADLIPSTPNSNTNKGDSPTNGGKLLGGGLDEPSTVDQTEPLNPGFVAGVLLPSKSNTGSQNDPNERLVAQLSDQFPSTELEINTVPSTSSDAPPPLQLKAARSVSFADSKEAPLSHSMIRAPSGMPPSDAKIAENAQSPSSDDDQSEKKRHQRHESRKSIKIDIESKQSRGEAFWTPEMLPQPKKENTVVLSFDAQEAEDSKQEIGFVNQYLFVRKLGEGSSGEVKLALNENDQKFYAIKILNRSTQKKRVSLSRKGHTRLSFFNGLPQEVAILKRITHPNIVNLYEVIDDPRIDRLYLVFEYVPGSQFPSSSEMNPLSVERARKYIKEVATGLNYCHTEGVCHGDIVSLISLLIFLLTVLKKPENLLLTPDDQIKISDFGVSYLVTDAVSKKRAGMGTPLFMAPEVVSAENKHFTPQPLDVWALGITLYVFVFGRCPFVAGSVIETYELIKNQSLTVSCTFQSDCYFYCFDLISSFHLILILS
jgi:hypothetical protein